MSALRVLLQDLIYEVYGEHYFSFLARINPKLSLFFYGVNYRNGRLWNSYPILKNADGSDLLFIHIPKCAGTSIAAVYGEAHIRHVPAQAFLQTDSSRYSTATTFAVVREPVERIRSMLLHMQSSLYATVEEKRIISELGINEANVLDYVERYLIDSSFRRKLHKRTLSGRNGFGVSQAEYLTFNGELIVDHVFAMTSLNKLEQFLSEKLGRTVQLPIKNQVSRKQAEAIPESLARLAKERLAKDYEIYESAI